MSRSIVRQELFEKNGWELYKLGIFSYEPRILLKGPELLAIAMDLAEILAIHQSYLIIYYVCKNLSKYSLDFDISTHNVFLTSSKCGDRYLQSAVKKAVRIDIFYFVKMFIVLSTICSFYVVCMTFLSCR